MWWDQFATGNQLYQALGQPGLLVMLRQEMYPQGDRITYPTWGTGYVIVSSRVIPWGSKDPVIFTMNGSWSRVGWLSSKILWPIQLSIFGSLNNFHRDEKMFNPVLWFDGMDVAWRSRGSGIRYLELIMAAWPHQLFDALSKIHTENKPFLRQISVRPEILSKLQWLGFGRCYRRKVRKGEWINH